MFCECACTCACECTRKQLSLAPQTQQPHPPSVSYLFVSEIMFGCFFFSSMAIEGGSECRHHQAYKRIVWDAGSTTPIYGCTAYFSKYLRSTAPRVGRAGKETESPFLQVRLEPKWQRRDFVISNAPPDQGVRGPAELLPPHVPCSFQQLSLATRTQQTHPPSVSYLFVC